MKQKVKLLNQVYGEGDDEFVTRINNFTDMDKGWKLVSVIANRGGYFVVFLVKEYI